jgi:hypothetical protein
MGSEKYDNGYAVKKTAIGFGDGLSGDCTMYPQQSRWARYTQGTTEYLGEPI